MTLPTNLQFEDINLCTSDVALQSAVAAAGGEMRADPISAFGARTGSAETAECAMQANGNLPQLKAFDRHRNDPVRVQSELTAIMHHASRFCPPGWRTHAVDPSVWIGVRQLAVQRIGD
jgi:Adaptive response protein AidB N-terminal domain